MTRSTASRCTLLALGVLAAATARAQGGGDEAYPLTLAVGETVALCATGTLLCPAAGTRCDDTAVVEPGADERGPVLTGRRPGTTLCSAASGSGLGMRRVYRLTVVDRRARPPAP